MSPLDAIVEQLADAVAARLAAILAERTTVAAEPATPWLNAEQAAAYIGDAPVSRIYDLIQTKKLTAKRDGRRVVLHTDDLDAYLRGTS
jgi:excisionase family DNA binding protein